MSKNRRSQQNNRQSNGRFPKGVSGNPNGRPRLDSGKQERTYTQSDMKAAVQEAIHAVSLDGWQSLLTSLGTDQDKSTSGMMVVEPVDYGTARNIWRGDSFGARIADARPREMFRAGWKLKISDADVAKDKALETPDGEPIKMTRKDARKLKRRLDALASKTKDLSERAMNKARDLQLDSILERALVLSNVDGGSAILIGANDNAKNWNLPLNLNALRTPDQLQWLTVVESRYMQPVAWYNNPRAPKFGQVAIWRIQPVLEGAGQGYDKTPGVQDPIEVHESRLIVFTGIKLTNSPSEGVLTAFGDSIYTRMQKTLARYSLGWNSAAVLLNEFALSAMKIKGLAEMASQDGKKKLLNRMQAIKLGRSICGITLLDKEEELTRDTATVTGLADLLFALMQELAGQADVPVTILMGMSPAGMNATGESDTRGWYDRIAAEWKKHMDPVMRYLLGILLRCINGGKEPEKWCVDLNPLWQESPKEKADARLVDATADEKNILNQIYTAEEARRSRFGGDEYGTEIQIDTDDEADAYDEADMAEAKQMQAEGALDPNAPKPGAPMDPNAPAPSSAAAGAPAAAPTDIQKQAMNGAQVTSLIEVVKAAVDGEIPRESAAAILEIAFQLSNADSERVLGPKDFEAKKPDPPPMPFGGGGGFGAKPPIAPDSGAKAGDGGAIPSGKEPAKNEPPIPTGKPEDKQPAAKEP